MKYLLSASIVLFSLYYLYANGSIFAGFETIKAKDAYQAMQSKQNEIVILDVRSKEEFEDGHIKSAISVPLSTIKNELIGLNQYKNKKIMVYCKNTRRSKLATKFLHEHEFDVLNIDDSYEDMLKNGFEKTIR